MVAIERDADLAMVGANGGGWVAPKDTAQPTDPTTAPVGAWAGLGAISEDGLTEGVAEAQQQFTPWGLTAPFKTVTTSSVRTFKVTCWETLRPEVRSLWSRVPAGSLTPDGSGVVTYADTASPSQDPRAFIFDVYDGDNFERHWVPNGEVTGRADVTNATGAMKGYEFTITAYPDDAGNTVYHSYLDPTA